MFVFKNVGPIKTWFGLNRKNERKEGKKKERKERRKRNKVEKVTNLFYNLTDA